MGTLKFEFSAPLFPNTLYLDKDGVVNDVVMRGNELSSPRSINEISLSCDLHFIKKFCDRENYNIVIISNQPDIRRGLIDQQFLFDYIVLLRDLLPINVAIFCPHLESENCLCRKPKNGMVLDYRASFPDSITNEIFIGDTEKDFNCANESGINFILKLHKFNTNYLGLKCKKIASFTEL